MKRAQNSKKLGSSVRSPSVRFGSKFESENSARLSSRFENSTRLEFEKKWFGPMSNPFCQDFPYEKHQNGDLFPFFVLVFAFLLPFWRRRTTVKTQYKYHTVDSQRAKLGALFLLPSVWAKRDGIWKGRGRIIR